MQKSVADTNADNSPRGPAAPRIADIIQTSSSLADAFERLAADHTERLKELGAISRVVAIVRRNEPLERLLQEVVDTLPAAWQYPEFTCARITYGDSVFITANFIETAWVQRQDFIVPQGPSGAIEVRYRKEFPALFEGPFLREERSLIDNLAQIIVTAACTRMYEQLSRQNRERLKELAAINQTARIVGQNAPIPQTLQAIADILPASWQYPQKTVARICFAGREYASAGSAETPWIQREEFVTFDGQTGTVEVFYSEELPDEDEGPFLKEERDLIGNIARLISHFINNHKGRSLLHRPPRTDDSAETEHRFPALIAAAESPLQRLLNRHVLGPRTHTDIMRHRVKNVLLVATFFDAYAIQNDDPFFGQFLGLLQPLAIPFRPRITVVLSNEDALARLGQGGFDMVIAMAGFDAARALSLHKELAEQRPGLPVFFLANRVDLTQTLAVPLLNSGYNRRLFVWTGDSRLFYAMVRILEDSMNALEDTSGGLVRAVLIVEDSPHYLSQLLVALYGLLFEQARHTAEGVELTDVERATRFLFRPRVLVARTYEDATHYAGTYGANLMCVVSDIEFDRRGVHSRTAGLELAAFIRNHAPSVPCLLHSTEPSHADAVTQAGAVFVNKNARGALERVRQFVSEFSTGSSFVFRSPDGTSIATARTPAELVSRLDEVSEDCVRYHALRNDFSQWFMARGETSLALDLSRADVRGLTEDTHVRAWVADQVRVNLVERNRGRLVEFDDVSGFGDEYVVRIVSGSLGGKGRGVSFLNALVREFDQSKLSSRLRVRTPLTAVIGTDQYERIAQSRRIREVVAGADNYELIRKEFAAAELSDKLKNRLYAFAAQVKSPIAVRSSSLLEDSYSQPFAGAFETYIVPNSHPDIQLRARQLELAVKLVYASLMRPDAQVYFESSHHGTDEERMGVVLQELAGRSFDHYYYPHISGVARSNNYYPVAHMRPEDGFAVLAFGLGAYVVEGRSGHRFCPRYPNVDFGSDKDMLHNSQVHFYAVDTSRTDIDLLSGGEKAALELLDITTAEQHGSLAHCASVFETANDRFVPSLRAKGPRILNFADILKHEYIPLPQTLGSVMNTLKDAMGVAVEIEFAVDLEGPTRPSTFHLLQVKPLAAEHLAYEFDSSLLHSPKTIIASGNALGNGRIDGLCDAVVVRREAFDRLKTLDMIPEIEYFNRKLSREDRPYMLVGPGRWGSRDASLGIGVNWMQIGQAKVIVEVGLEGYPLDASLGSHFFHNVTALNIGYIAVQESAAGELINWDRFANATEIECRRYFRHIRFDPPLAVHLDGRQRRAAVIWDE